MGSRKSPEWKRLLMPSDRPGQEDFLGAVRVPVVALAPNPEQPRKGELTGIEELAASIREYGLLQPIIVAPPLGGRYTVIAGHRRLAAFRWLAEHDDPPAHWATIPAIERDVETADRLVLAMVENLARQSLSDTDIIAGLSVLRDLRGWSQSEIARRLGVTSAWISQYFRVATDNQVAPLVRMGQVSVSKAYEIAKATPEVRRRVIDAAVSGASLQTLRRLRQEQTGARPECDASGAGGSESSNGRAANGHAPEPEEGVLSDLTPPLRVSATAGVRDLAELAAEHDLRVRLRDTGLGKLVRAALENGRDDVRLADFIRLLREDMRTAEALVRVRSGTQ